MKENSSLCKHRMSCTNKKNLQIMFSMAYVTLQVVSLHAYCLPAHYWAPVAPFNEVACGLFFWRECHAGWGISVPWLGIEPRTPVVEAQSPNLWTTLEFPPMVLKSHVSVLFILLCLCQALSSNGLHWKFNFDLIPEKNSVYSLGQQHF